jgi:hypothetical protein
LILDVASLKHTLGLVIEEIIFVYVVLPLVMVLNYHVGADIHQEGVDALNDHLLDIWPLYKSG